jgi:O-antigen ligase
MLAHMENWVKNHDLGVATAFIVSLLVIPKFMDPFNVPKLVVLSIGTWLLLSRLFLDRHRFRIESAAQTLIVSSFFLIALASASLASEQSFYRTVFGAWGRNDGFLTYFCFIVLFVSISISSSIDISVKFFRTFTHLGIIFTIYGYIQFNGYDVIGWDNTGNKIILTLGNPDFASAILACTAIASLVNLVKINQNTIKKLFYSFTFILQTYLIIKTGALQGVIVLLIGSALIIGFWTRTNQKSIVRKAEKPWWVFCMSLALLGILGLFKIGPLFVALNPSIRSLQDRYYHWVAATKMMMENPVFGVGVDAFGDSYRKFRVREALELREYSNSGTNNAHNVFMQLGATGGFPLLIAYVCLTLFIFWRATIALQRSKTKIFTVGIFVIWIGFQIQSMVSIDQIGLAVWSWISAGCLVHDSFAAPKTRQLNSQPKTNKKEPQNLFRFLILLLLIACLSPTMSNEYSIRNQLEELISSTTDSELRQNSKMLYREALKSEQPELRIITLDYLMQAKENNLAIKLAKQTVTDFPNSYEAWNKLATISERTGALNLNTKARKKLVILDPLRIEVKKF